MNLNTLSPGHLVVISTSDILGVILNVHLILSIKFGKSSLNVVERMQILKTCLAVLAALVFVPLDVNSTRWPVTPIDVRITRDVAEGALFHSLVALFFAMAIVRLRVVRCRGNASVLVGGKFALIVTLLSLLPECVCIMLRIPMSVHWRAVHSLGSDRNNSSMEGMSPNVDLQTYNWLNILTLCFGLVLPLVSACVVYGFVFSTLASYQVTSMRVWSISRKFSVRMSARVVSENKSQSNSIRRSISVSMISVVVPWLLYIVLHFLKIEVYGEMQDLAFIYLKLVILFIHPFGEGIALKTKRENLLRFYRLLCSRNNVPSSSSSRRADNVANVTIRVPRADTAQMTKVDDEIASSNCQTYKLVSCSSNHERRVSVEVCGSVPVKDADTGSQSPPPEVQQINTEHRNNRNIYVNEACSEDQPQEHVCNAILNPVLISPLTRKYNSLLSVGQKSAGLTESGSLKRLSTDSIQTSVSSSNLPRISVGCETPSQGLSKGYYDDDTGTHSRSVSPFEGRSEPINITGRVSVYSEVDVVDNAPTPNDGNKEPGETDVFIEEILEANPTYKTDFTTTESRFAPISKDIWKDTNKFTKRKKNHVSGRKSEVTFSSISNKLESQHIRHASESAPSPPCITRITFVDEENVQETANRAFTKRWPKVTIEEYGTDSGMSDLQVQTRRSGIRSPTDSGVISPLNPGVSEDNTMSPFRRRFARQHSRCSKEDHASTTPLSSTCTLESSPSEASSPSHGRVIDYPRSLMPKDKRSIGRGGYITPMEFF